MYVTTISTKTESCDDGLYTVFSKEKPTEQQIDWYIRKHGEQEDGLLYEHIVESSSIIFEELEVFPTADPNPELETM